MHKNILHLMFTIVIVLAISGCVGSDVNDTDIPSQDRAGIIHVASLGDINAALESGAVLVEIGSERCPTCKAQMPIMEEIAAEYEGRASVMYIDTAKVGALGFGVRYVPDSFVIVGIENKTYVYMKPDGQITSNREEARFVGLTRKAVLTQTLDHALEELNRSSLQV
ncbi:thioredoxin family protein [Methanolobus sp.]|uniref:thioredoxin family protein n=1 Tax=Methanolobus sp. TaxID=1874737 RepID=UPI00260109F9|nr:thioredoxin family protein [Methanolobus sp.]